MKPGRSPAPLHSGRAERWTLGLALAGSFLAVSPLQSAAYSLPKLWMLAAGVALAWAALLRRAAPERASPLDLPLGACALVLLASCFTSSDPFLSVVGRYKMYSLGLLPLTLCGAFYYAALRSGQPEEPLPLLRLCAALGVVMGVHALFQAGGVEPIAFMPRNFPNGRAVGTLGNPAYLGACLVGLFPLSLGVALDEDRRWRPLGWAGVAGVLAALFACGSRGAFLGAAAGAVAYLWAAGRLRAPANRLLWAGALVVLVLAGVAASSRLRRVSVSDSARLAMWASALDAVPEAPWLGTGPDTFEALLRRHRRDDFIRALGPNAGQANAHNDFLQALTTTGVAGFGAYLWLWSALAVLAWRARGDARRAAAVGALAGLFVQAKVNPIPLPGLALAALCAALLNPPPSRTPPPRSVARDAAVLVLCAAAFLLTHRLAAADRSHKMAAVFYGAHRLDVALPSFERAVRLNPGEIQYRMTYANALHQLSSKVDDPGRRLAWLERAVTLGREAVSWRPSEVDAHQILGTSLILLRRAGGPDRLDEAQAELDRASELDPKFGPLMRNRIVLAGMRGDEARVKALSAELRRLEELKP